MNKVDPIEQRKLTDARTIKDTQSWPRWPYLPVKRNKGGLYELGYILAGNRQTVFIGNMYAPPSSENPHITYVSVEKLVDDGWMVD